MPCPILYLLQLQFSMQGSLIDKSQHHYSAGWCRSLWQRRSCRHEWRWSCDDLFMWTAVISLPLCCHRYSWGHGMTATQCISETNTRKISINSFVLYFLSQRKTDDKSIVNTPLYINLFSFHVIFDSHRSVSSLETVHCNTTTIFSFTNLKKYNPTQATTTV